VTDVSYGGFFPRLSKTKTAFLCKYGNPHVRTQKLQLPFSPSHLVLKNCTEKLCDDDEDLGVGALDDELVTPPHRCDLVKIQGTRSAEKFQIAAAAARTLPAENPLTYVKRLRSVVVRGHRQPLWRTSLAAGGPGQE